MVSEKERIRNELNVKKEAFLTILRNFRRRSHTVMAIFECMKNENASDKKSPVARPCCCGFNKNIVGVLYARTILYG